MHRLDTAPTLSRRAPGRSGSARRRLVAMAAVVAVSPLAIVGYRLWFGPPDWQVSAAKIPGILDQHDASAVKRPRHRTGRLTYSASPPFGGDHNPTWQNCMGDVYDQP